jgi:hypothetical protein
MTLERTAQTGKPGQASLDRPVRTGQRRWGAMTARTGLRGAVSWGSERKSRTAGTEQAGQEKTARGDSQDSTARKGNRGQDSQNMRARQGNGYGTSVAGQSGHDIWDSTTKTAQLGQDVGTGQLE